MIIPGVYARWTGLHGDGTFGMDDLIERMARSLAERFGARALALVASQVDQADQDTRPTWVSIRDWLKLYAGENGSP